MYRYSLTFSFMKIPIIYSNSFNNSLTFIKYMSLCLKNTNALFSMEVLWTLCSSWFDDRTIFIVSKMDIDKNYYNLQHNMHEVLNSVRKLNQPEQYIVCKPQWNQFINPQPLCCQTRVKSLPATCLEKTHCKLEGRVLCIAD